MNVKNFIFNENKGCNVFNGPVNGATFIMGGQFNKQAETQTSSSETEWETTEEQVQPVATMPLKETITSTMPMDDRNIGIRKSIIELLNVTENGKELFCNIGHWAAVYRVLVDNNFIRDGFKEFASFLKSLQLPEMRIPFKYETVKKTVGQSGLYYRPLDQWENRYNAELINYKSYNSMLKNAYTFRDILERNGVI